MASSDPASLTPGQRLWHLLASERRDITYLYIYAALTGLISLTLPLGVQSVIGFVSSGDVSTSLVVLIGFIVFGTFAVGALQVMQLYLVEFIQQRLFARISLDFAVRLPRVRTESLDGQYLPELMNRLLDTPTLQKGLSTLLVEFSAAALQILFGLILLSFYHPIFIAFGLLLIALLALMIRFTGSRGLETSLAGVEVQVPGGGLARRRGPHGAHLPPRPAPAAGPAPHRRSGGRLPHGPAESLPGAADPVLGLRGLQNPHYGRPAHHRVLAADRPSSSTSASLWRPKS